MDKAYEVFLAAYKDFAENWVEEECTRHEMREALEAAMEAANLPE